MRTAALTLLLLVLLLALLGSATTCYQRKTRASCLSAPVDDECSWCTTRAFCAPTRAVQQCDQWEDDPLDTLLTRLFGSPSRSNAVNTLLDGPRTAQFWATATLLFLLCAIPVGICYLAWYHREPRRFVLRIDKAE